MASDTSKTLKAAVRLTREQIAEIMEVHATALQDDQNLDGITLLVDPDAVQVSEWCIHPDAHPFIAL